MKRRILVANRGEIAARIFQGIYERGDIPVALAGPGDETARHTWFATEVFPVSSYLAIPEITEICVRGKIDFVHPGYGFLSERASFIRSLDQAKIGFIGPRADSVEALGDKINAKKIAEKAQVPTLPWGIVAPGSDLKSIAKKVGFPLLLKAAAGGGGKGMRLCESLDDLESLAESASREALSAFGDGSLFLEKKLVNPRHIEVQVFGDGEGGGVHLYERDCSLQRRNQKVIEEARATNLREETRKILFEASLRLVKEVNYRSAGTLEFLVDQEENVFFLEMNTRLQVEHTVTESVTGIDLVHAQLALAQDPNHFPIHSPVTCQGHSIEARIYAEDPALGFAPTPGPAVFLKWPQGTGIRVEAGVEEGQSISMNYDAMCGKIIVSAEDRLTAIARLRYALSHTLIAGFKTNLPYLLKICELPAFLSGTHHIGTLTAEHDALIEIKISSQTQEWLVSSNQYRNSKESLLDLDSVASPSSAWNSFSGKVN